jgi:hypothetical protein
VKKGIVVMCIAGALGLAAPAFAKQDSHVNNERDFRVSQTFSTTCAGFFTAGGENIEGWSGRLHEKYTLEAPVYLDVSAKVNADWTDATTGLDYHLRFSGDAAGPSLSADAAGDVVINRSDGLTLSGSASYISDQSLIFLQAVSCG